MKISIQEKILRLLADEKRLEDIGFPKESIIPIQKEIDFYTKEFENGKRYIHQINDTRLKKRWEYITPINKKEYFEKNSFCGLKFTDTVQCIHCGEVFPVSEYIVLRDNLREQEFICCKNHEKCDGDLKDFMKVNKNIKGENNDSKSR